ncbi:MAG: DsrE family protein [Gemmatimonadota bacterium]|jgi:intracellular sulfur oxidation DsrE/DsrF family protein
MTLGRITPFSAVFGGGRALTTARGRAGLVLATTFLLAVPLVAQTPTAEPLGEAEDGPVIRGYGAVYDVPFQDVETPVDREYRVVFEVARSGEPGTVNPYLNTVARFLNMHARDGVPVEWMHVAVVIHGEAAKDALREGPFRERYGVDNANLELIRALSDAGVELYMCGQSAMARGLPPDELDGSLHFALSAMTARAILRVRGYQTVN